INREGTTIILTTHYLEEAEILCRDIAIINGGRIVEQGRTRDLLAKLHAETFELDLREPVAQAPVVPGYDIRRVDAKTIEADVHKEQGVNDLFAALSAQGHEVVSMRNKVNRLEELFVRMTEGKR